MVIRTAGPGDVEPMLALMDGVIAWLVARGRSGQWGSAPPSGSAEFRQWTEQAVAAGMVTVAEGDGKVVGGMLLGLDHPAYLPAGLVPDDALYLHRLVSDRGPAGRGAGARLLDHAWSRAQALGVLLALDHWAGSPELAELYEKAGFAEVGGFTLEHDPPWPGTVEPYEPRNRRSGRAVAHRGALPG